MCARRTLWVPRGLLLVRRPEGLVTCELMGVVRRGILILQHRRACAARSRAESGADMQARASRTVRAHGGVAATVEAGRPTRRPRGAAAAARASAAEAERAGSRLTHKATSATACTNRCAGCCGTGTGTGHGRGHGSGRGRGRSRRGAGCTRGRAVACVRARARTKAPEVCQSPLAPPKGPLLEFCYGIAFCIHRNTVLRIRERKNLGHSQNRVSRTRISVMDERRTRARASERASDGIL